MKRILVGSIVKDETSIKKAILIGYEITTLSSMALVKVIEPEDFVGHNGGSPVSLHQIIDHLGNPVKVETDEEDKKYYYLHTDSLSVLQPPTPKIKIKIKIPKL